MSEQQSKQIASLETLLLKDAQLFKQQADETLQKQIMAAVEREAKSNSQPPQLKPLNTKKLAWWFSGLSVAAVASFLSITLIPQLLVPIDQAKRVTAPAFSMVQRMESIKQNIKTFESQSISKIDVEKEAIEKDIQRIIDAFLLDKGKV